MALFPTGGLAGAGAVLLPGGGPKSRPASRPTGANPNPPHTWGRAQLRVEDCSVQYDPGVADGSTPPFCMTGGVTGTVEFVRCSVVGLDVPLSRGDFNAFDFQANGVPRPCTNLLVKGFTATASNGVARSPRIVCADPNWTSQP